MQLTKHRDEVDGKLALEPAWLAEANRDRIYGGLPENLTTVPPTRCGPGGHMRRRQFITFFGAAAAVWKHAKRPTTLLREAGYLLLGVVSLATVNGLSFW